MEIFLFKKIIFITNIRQKNREFFYLKKSGSMFSRSYPSQSPARHPFFICSANLSAQWHGVPGKGLAMEEGKFPCNKRRITRRRSSNPAFLHPLLELNGAEIAVFLNNLFEILTIIVEYLFLCGI